MFSVFKPTHSPIRIGFRWLNPQVHQWSQLNCKPIHLVIHSNCLWSHTSERGSDHFWWNAFLRLWNIRTDQFLRSLFCRPVSSWIPSAIHSFRTPSLNGLFKDTSSDWRREVRVWRKCSQYLSCELQMSRKQASSFSSPGHRSVHFYFLCCVFNVCKLGRAWQTIESFYNTHRDFDACFYGKKSAHYTRVNTVSPTWKLVPNTIVYMLRMTRKRNWKCCDQKNLHWIKSIIWISFVTLPNYLFCPR